MPVHPFEGVVTPRPTPDKGFRDTRATMLSQILDIDDEVMEQTNQTDILAMM